MKTKCPQTKLHPNRLAQRRLGAARLLASIERLETKRKQAFDNLHRLTPTCASQYHYSRRARYWLRTATRLWDKQEQMLANFDYFLGKCQASPTGREFTQWDPRTAFMSMGSTCGEEGMESIKEACKELTTGSCQEDYAEAASEYYDRSGDAEGAGMIREFGTVPSVHAIGMFVGLQMALKQLKEAKV